MAVKEQEKKSDTRTAHRLEKPDLLERERWMEAWLVGTGASIWSGLVQWVHCMFVMKHSQQI
jgi:hypothetical protein